jgi:hypothetical protein
VHRKVVLQAIEAVDVVVQRRRLNPEVVGEVANGDVVAARYIDALGSLLENFVNRQIAFRHCSTIPDATPPDLKRHQRSARLLRTLTSPSDIAI